MHMNMGRPVGNKFKVPAKVWAEYNNLAKRVYNDTYHSMRPTKQAEFRAANKPPLPLAELNPIRQYAALIAAGAVMRIANGK